MFCIFIFIFIFEAAWSQSWEEFKSKEYLVKMTPLPYKDAAAICTKENGILAVVSSQEIQNFLEMLLKKNSSEAVKSWYIGLEQDKFGIYRWIDETKITYVNLQRQECNNNAGKCAAIVIVNKDKSALCGFSECCNNENFTWHNQPCKSSAAFICQRPLISKGNLTQRRITSYFSSLTPTKETTSDQTKQLEPLPIVLVAVPCVIGGFILGIFVTAIFFFLTRWHTQRKKMNVTEKLNKSNQAKNIYIGNVNVPVEHEVEPEHLQPIQAQDNGFNSQGCSFASNSTNVYDNVTEVAYINIK